MVILRVVNSLNGRKSLCLSERRPIREMETWSAQRAKATATRRSNLTSGCNSMRMRYIKIPSSNTKSGFAEAKRRCRLTRIGAIIGLGSPTTAHGWPDRRQTGTLMKDSRSHSSRGRAVDLVQSRMNVWSLRIAWPVISCPWLPDSRVDKTNAGLCELESYVSRRGVF
ncbi:hypothetical protein BKA80DRAFT_274388 [Phyllosticta citrichinensis]